MIGRVAAPADKRTCSGSAAHCRGFGHRLKNVLAADEYAVLPRPVRLR
jgi:hypothetical protein